MEAVVSETGLTLPKRMLRGMRHVSITKKHGIITITAKAADAPAVNDPLLGLGSAPAKQALRTGSSQHDQTIYNGQ